MEKISVLIVDDHAMVRRGLKSFLESEEGIEVIGEAADGEQALQLVLEQPPDVILMDLVMPGLGGIETTRRIQAVSPGSRVLILTSFGEDEKVFASIKAGALGYLLKDVPAEDLGRAIRSVANGEFLLHPQIARRVLEEFALSQPQAAAQAFPGSLHSNLTPRELDVLALVARGLKNKAIAVQLGISIKTVKTHISNIFSKLHIFDRTQAALYAVQQGLLPGQGSEISRASDQLQGKT